MSDETPHTSGETLRAAAARLRDGDTRVPPSVAGALDRVTVAVGGGVRVEHSTVQEALAVARAILREA